jgi:hypothetical protein
VGFHTTGTSLHICGTSLGSIASLETPELLSNPRQELGEKWFVSQWLPREIPVNNASFDVNTASQTHINKNMEDWKNIKDQ